MSACRRDLLANGIDLGRAGPGSLRRLVRRHLDYFQLMLGYDATPAEVIAQCRRSESNGRRQDARSGRV